MHQVLFLIVAGLILLVAGFVTLRYRRREETRRIAAFDRKHSVVRGGEAPKVLVKDSGSGSEFVNVGGLEKFQPPEGFVSMERTIEDIRKELSWLFWLGATLRGSGLLLLIVGTVQAAISL